MNHDMGELIAGGAPWRIPAICVECGSPHEAHTWSPTKRDYGGPPTRFGTCSDCITAEQKEMEACKRALEHPPESKVPNLEEAKRKLLDESLHEDVFDPFHARKDLFG